MSLTVLNPATEEPIAELEQVGVEETDEAVSRAPLLGLDARVESRCVNAHTPYGLSGSIWTRDGELGMQPLDGYSEVKGVFISTEGA